MKLNEMVKCTITVQDLEEKFIYGKVKTNKRVKGNKTKNDYNTLPQEI